MDNLTHSLAGAVLGQMGLKTKTGLGMATLIIAANIPDIDAVATLLDGVQHLAIRRGITHGPIAMLLLPLLLTGIMIWFDRWQTRRGKRPADRLPIHRGWLLALAYIGCLSHPALDWLNSYGIRLLEPFSSQWFYGDSIFIIDIWIWVALIAGVWVSWRREKKGSPNWQRPAWISFSVVCAYIFANGLITGHAERLVFEDSRKSGKEIPRIVVANPVPIAFWRREILLNIGENGSPYLQQFAKVDYSIFDDKPDYKNGSALIEDFGAACDEPFVDSQRAASKDLDAFLFWSRMPYSVPGPFDIVYKDARFSGPLVADRFSVTLEWNCYNSFFDHLE